MFTSLGVCDTTRIAPGVKEKFSSLCLMQQSWRGHAKQFHDACQLFHLVLSWEEGIACVELCQDASKAPHVNRHAVREAKYDLWRAVEARLDVRVDPLVLIAAGAKINHLD